MAGSKRAKRPAEEPSEAAAGTEQEYISSADSSSKDTKPHRKRKSRKTPDEEVGEAAVEAPSSNSTKTPNSKRQRLAVRVKDEQNAEASASSSTTPASAHAPVTGKKTVFGDDDEATKFYTPLQTPSGLLNQVSALGQQDDQNDDEEDDDDAPPEAISTQATAKVAAESAEAAEKAAEKQSATAKAKRKDRDAKLKLQAAKRKAPAKKADPSSPSGSDAEDGDATASVAKPTSLVKTRTKRSKLPTVLPASYLESDSDDGDGDEEATAATTTTVATKPTGPETYTTKLRALSKSQEKLSGGSRNLIMADQRVIGSTAYRVMGKSQDERLAPRASKSSKNMREQLLGRRRAREPPRREKGFFVVET